MYVDPGSTPTSSATSPVNYRFRQSAGWSPAPAAKNLAVEMITPSTKRNRSSAAAKSFIVVPDEHYEHDAIDEHARGTIPTSRAPRSFTSSFRAPPAGFMTARTTSPGPFATPFLSESGRSTGRCCSGRRIRADPEEKGRLPLAHTTVRRVSLSLNFPSKDVTQEPSISSWIASPEGRTNGEVPVLRRSSSPLYMSVQDGGLQILALHESWSLAQMTIASSTTICCRAEAFRRDGAGV